MKKEIKDAFLKMQSSIYYDNSQLIYRKRLAEVGDDLKKQEEIVCGKVEKLLYSDDIDKDQIKLVFYPKKICLEKDIEKQLSLFYTNEVLKVNSIVKRLMIFCDLPIEYLMISYLWTIKYGVYLDNVLGKAIVGNRLNISLCKKVPKISEGKILTKPYYAQYNKWWSDALEEAKHFLDKKEDVTIVNMDLQDYYHSIRFSFEEIEKEIESVLKKDIREDKIHILFKDISKAYSRKYSKYFKSTFDENLYNLPVGLPSSYVLANWYLKQFDENILQEVNPAYYGRYVDDIILVIKDRVVRDFNKRVEDVKDVIIKDIFKDILKEKKDVDKEEKEYYIEPRKGVKITIQKEKLYIYQFNHKYTSTVINKFIEDQKSRSSEFRFLSDDLDESFKNTSLFSFESNFEDNGLTNAKFTVVEANKFKMSVYLSKLIFKKLRNDDKLYNIESLDKVNKYFRGQNVIKHYVFWEKIFTLFLVYNKPKLILNFLRRTLDEIENIKIEGIKVDDKNFINDQDSVDDLKECLKSHLYESFYLAVGLNPNCFCDFNLEELKCIKDTTIESDHYNKYRRAGLLRDKYCYYRLGQYRDNSDSNLLIKDGASKLNIETLNDIKLPFNVCISDLMYEEYNYQSNKGKLNVDLSLDKAIGTYESINNSIVTKDFINNIKRNQIENDLDVQFKYKHWISKESKSITKDKLVCSVVNMSLNIEDTELSIKGTPRLSVFREKEFKRILDEITKSKCDIFVMPEFAIPFHYIPSLIDYCRKNKVAVVTGVEHVEINKDIYNYILTVLPISYDYIVDALPVFRLKNSYSPHEIKYIDDNRYNIPKEIASQRSGEGEMIRHYDLYTFRNVNFAPYCCFELANPNDRSLFFGKTDLIVAPVYNKDIYYFDNIIESTVRDMHCFFALSNPSQYGNSHISGPYSKNNLNLALIKGGTTDDYTFNIVSAVLDIKKLRNFQKKSIIGQLSKPCEFKPTPPYYPVSYVEKREKGELFKESKKIVNNLKK